MSCVKDMSGARIGAWTVLHENGRDRNGQAFWVCLCDCGTQKNVTGGRLRRGDSMSCGCKKPEVSAAANTKHGNSARGELTAEYRTWSGIIDRCERPGNAQFDDYGGRGITVCERWRSDFANFLSDMGPRPSALYTIDRIDNERGYSPENCRWATRKEQCRNKRNNLLVVVDGERLVLSAASEKLGVRYTTAYARFVAAGRPSGEVGAVLRGPCKT
jgi:hypothetical protein